MKNYIFNSHLFYSGLVKSICVFILLIPLFVTPSFVSANHVVCNDVAKPWNTLKNTCTVGRHHVEEAATDPMTYVWIGLAVVAVAAMLSFSETEQNSTVVKIYDPFEGLSIFERQFVKSDSNFSINMFKVENPRENVPSINQFYLNQGHDDELFLESLDRVDFLEFKLNF